MPSLRGRANRRCFGCGFTHDSCRNHCLGLGGGCGGGPAAECRMGFRQGRALVARVPGRPVGRIGRIGRIGPAGRMVREQRLAPRGLLRFPASCQLGTLASVREQRQSLGGTAVRRAAAMPPSLHEGSGKMSLPGGGSGLAPSSFFLAPPRQAARRRFHSGEQRQPHRQASTRGPGRLVSPAGLGAGPASRSLAFPRPWPEYRRRRGSSPSPRRARARFAA